MRVVPEVPEALLILSPGAVEADGAIESLLYDRPAASEGLHVAEDLKGPVAGIRGDTVHAVLSCLQHVVVGAVPRR